MDESSQGDSLLKGQGWWGQVFVSNLSEESFAFDSSFVDDSVEQRRMLCRSTNASGSTASACESGSDVAESL